MRTHAIRLRRERAMGGVAGIEQLRWSFSSGLLETYKVKLMQM